MESLDETQKAYVEALHTRCDRMGEFLLRKVDDGQVKDKLLDQLKWLQYQIKYYAEKQSFALLEENYNWVASNFNHDLHLQSSTEFTYIHEFTRG